MIRRFASLSAIPIPSSSTVTTRTASSFPVPSSHIPTCRPILAGRGRVKSPGRASISARIYAARQGREAQSTNGDSGASGVKSSKGRSKKRSSSIYQPETVSILNSVPEGTVVDALHLGLTPSHLPLPIPLGVEHYYGAPGSPVNPVPTPHQWTSSLGPFDTAFSSTSTLQGDISAMVKANGEGFDSHRSTLNDHLHVIYALARPGRAHYLGQPTYNAEFFDSDLPSLTSTLNSAVNEAGARNALAAETEWNDILAKFSGRSTASPTSVEAIVSQEEQSAVQAAVSDLTVLLDGLEMEEAAASSRPRSSSARMVAVVDEDGNEEWIRMDSTRRKRRKKINKHKYKKRRKAQRALRKKLGK